MNSFEQQFNSLIFLKALFIWNGEGGFDEVIQQEYNDAWERAFELL